MGGCREIFQHSPGKVFTVRSGQSLPASRCVLASEEESSGLSGRNTQSRAGAAGREGGVGAERGDTPMDTVVGGGRGGGIIPGNSN